MMTASDLGSASAYRSVPLRRVFRIANGGTPTADADNWDGEIGWFTPEDLSPRFAEAPDRSRRSLTTRGLATCSATVGPAGSLVLTARAPIGNLGLLAYPAAVNQGCRLLIPKPGTFCRYFAYVLEASTGDLRSLGQGSTFQEISSMKLGSYRVPAPPFHSQRAIADYLDRETGRIDALVEAKRRLMTLLTERLSSLVVRLSVNQYSADGAPTADDFRPSSRSRPAKRLMRKLDRGIRPDDEVVTAFRDGEVNVRSARRSDGYTFSEIEDQYQGVEPGDIVFHGLDGFAGAVGTSVARGKCTPVYHVCEAVNGNDARFVALTLRTLGVIGFLAAQSGNVRERSVDFRTWRALARVPLPTPELQVQSAAAVEAINATHTERHLRNLLERQLALLQEYRQALITSVVNGALEISALG